MSVAAEDRCLQSCSGIDWRLTRVLVPALFSVAGPAHAQVSAQVSLSNNAIFRGETISSGDSAASIEVDFDHSSGFYVGGSVSVAAGEDRPRVVTSTQFAGYSARMGEVSLDAGVIHRHYREVADPEYASDYFEGYVGLARRNSSVRLFVSPDFAPNSRFGAYLDANLGVAKIKKWSIGVHGGMTVLPPERGHGGPYSAEFDWAVQASRPLGKFAMSVAVADSDRTEPGVRHGPRFFLTISRPL